MTDTEREQAIEVAKLKCLGAQTSTESRAALDEMRLLINGRSPETIIELELARGLRAA